MIKGRVKNIGKLKHSVANWDKDVQKETKSFIYKLGLEARKRAIMVAPVYSGDTIRNILVSQANNNLVLVVANNTTPRKGGFNLQKWMHESPLARSHIKSGSPTFMKDAMLSLQASLKGKLKSLAVKLKLK